MAQNNYSYYDDKEKVDPLQTTTIFNSTENKSNMGSETTQEESGHGGKVYPIEFTPDKSTRNSNELVEKLKNYFKLVKPIIVTFIKVFAILLWFIYLIFASYFDFTGEFDKERNDTNVNDETLMDHPSLPLIAITIISILFWSYSFISARINRESLAGNCSALTSFYNNHSKKITMVIFALVFLGCIIEIGVTMGEMSGGQWKSLLGYILLPFLLCLMSAKRRGIKVRPVLGGLLIQLVFAIFVSTSFGSQLFEYLGNLAQTFLNFVEEGYNFLFGETLTASAPFAFTVLPIVIYVSSVVGVLYYLGAMEWLIKKIGFVMYSILRTSATESMVASGNIFIGQSEAPLLIRPYLKNCTNSELLAIMAAGMGTVAGSTLGAYINFGVDPVYVITASFMAAPTVLALSKIMYPETEKSKFKNFSEMKFENAEGVENVVDAAAKGATDAVPLVANIAAALIAFMSIARAVDELLSQLGRLLGQYDPLITLDLIFSYLFYPISFILGVDNLDLLTVSQLIGKKIVINEFIAYQEMTSLLPYRSAGCVRSDWISKRSECITTYALCGFANISSMAITLGGLGPMAPNKRQNMSRLVFRALIVGCFTSFMNAALSGFLGRITISDAENEQGFYTDCSPFCCAFAKNDQNLTMPLDSDDAFCDLTAPDEGYDCYTKCAEFNFNNDCDVSSLTLEWKSFKSYWKTYKPLKAETLRWPKIVQIG